MPVYEYFCEPCSCRFEQYREVSRRAACRCPKCGKPARKTFRPVEIIFKGPGFYSNDSRKPEGTTKSETDSPRPEPAGVGTDKHGEAGGTD